ncbi:hypothetical protein [Chryseobacterium sp. T16E-39]|uniref:hypothetical protein n=1 Tax=Chryseobacterium sp. T16E-39 TaxID=2015076 RepID=UPI0012FB363A|nr:hypothetical protein [Chryseobacterium sp. T16E-39]
MSESIERLQNVAALEFIKNVDFSSSILGENLMQDLRSATKAFDDLSNKLKMDTSQVSLRTGAEVYCNYGTIRPEDINYEYKVMVSIRN